MATLKRLFGGQAAKPGTPTPKDGVFFGLHGSTPITKPMNEGGHVLVIGGSNSGKSTSIAIPTLKSYWKGRVLAIDMKGELATNSQRQGRIFNPENAAASGYDPFYLLKSSPNPIADIQQIVLTLVPMPHEVKDPFWTKSAQDLLTGHLLYGYRHGAGFIQCLDMLQSISPRKVIQAASRDEESAKFVRQFGDLRPETLGSIMSTLSGNIMLFATDPGVQAALRKKDIITPEQLEQGENIFLQLPEHRLKQWGTLLSLIIQQFLQHFERRPENRDNAPILFLLDEFARLGKIEEVASGLNTLRSKNITICLLIQSLAQLDVIYGEGQRKIILDNCTYQAILSAADADTQEYFSRLIGTEERLKTSVSQGGYDSTLKNLVKSAKVEQVSARRVSTQREE